MKKILLMTALCLPVLAAPAFADTYVEDHNNYEGIRGNTTSHSSETSTTTTTTTTSTPVAYNDIAPAAGGRGPVGRAGSFDGPYAGIEAGYSWTKGDTTGAGTSDADLNNMNYGVLAGWGFQFNPSFLSSIWSGYVGAEVNYDWKGTTNAIANGVNAKQGGTFNASLRPGVTWGNTALGYGIVGYSRSRFDLAGDDEWLDGWQVGAGTELGDLGPFKTRVEYTYTNYESHTFDDGVKMNPHDNAVKVAGTIHFNTPTSW